MESHDGDLNDAGELDAITDLMDNEFSEASNKQDTSAEHKFNAYLRKHVHKALSMKTIAVKQVSKKLVGEFTTCLYKDSKIEWQTSMNYLSSVKRQLEASTSTTTLFSNDENWYKRCRKNLHKHYILTCIRDGKRLKGQAPLMTMGDLANIARILFARNDKKSLQDRTLLNNQWVAIGRSSNIGTVTFGNLEWQDSYLLVNLTR